VLLCCYDTQINQLQLTASVSCCGAWPSYLAALRCCATALCTTLLHLAHNFAECCSASRRTCIAAIFVNLAAGVTSYTQVARLEQRVLAVSTECEAVSASLDDPFMHDHYAPGAR
jgi:hypothetical protein